MHKSFNWYNKQMFQIGEFSKTAQTSVSQLRDYNEIGLFQMVEIRLRQIEQEGKLCKDDIVIKTIPYRS